MLHNITTCLVLKTVFTQPTASDQLCLVFQSESCLLFLAPALLADPQKPLSQVINTGGRNFCWHVKFVLTSFFVLSCDDCEYTLVRQTRRSNVSRIPRTTTFHIFIFYFPFFFFFYILDILCG